MYNNLGIQQIDAKNLLLYASLCILHSVYINLSMYFHYLIKIYNLNLLSARSPSYYKAIVVAFTL